MNDLSALSSFPQNFRACVFGASGGIGGALVEALAAHPRVGQVYAGARKPPSAHTDKVRPFSFDLEDEASIAAACALAASEGPLHLVLIATGMLQDGAGLQPEKTWRAIDPQAMARAFAINAIGPALIAKHMLANLAKDDKAAFGALSARVGSIGDNHLGGWHSYRASKAALNMLIKNFAIELAKRNPSALAVALHPGTVNTNLSKPFQSGVPEGKLFSPQQSAGYLLNVIDALTPAQSGGAFAWDGQRIPE